MGGEGSFWLARRFYRLGYIITDVLGQVVVNLLTSTIPGTCFRVH